jgi:hypothetical protein
VKFFAGHAAARGFSQMSSNVSFPDKEGGRYPPPPPHGGGGVVPLRKNYWQGGGGRHTTPENFTAREKSLPLIVDYLDDTFSDFNHFFITNIKDY